MIIKNMCKMRVIILLCLYAHIVRTIVQQCENQSNSTLQCPSNSFCNNNGYCQCNTGYILDCETYAEPINQASKQFQLEGNVETLFLISPSNNQSIFFYKFNLCQQNSNQYVLYTLALYADNGKSNKLLDKNRIGKASINQNRECWSLLSPYLRFETQQNGIVEQMVLIIKIEEPSQSGISKVMNQINGTQPKDAPKHKLKISVDELSFFNIQTLWTILISFLSFTLLSFIGGIIYCICWYRRGGWRRERDRNNNNLQHFEKYLPKIKVTKKNIVILLKNQPSCSICLFDFQLGDKFRKTNCHHFFHADCLDEWCKKKLSCPVCRQSLKQQDVCESQTDANSFKEQSIISNDGHDGHDDINLEQINEDGVDWKQQKQKNMIRQKLID